REREARGADLRKAFLMAARSRNRPSGSSCGGEHCRLVTCKERRRHGVGEESGLLLDLAVAADDAEGGVDSGEAWQARREATDVTVSSSPAKSPAKSC